jgi:hypothetical protein
MRRLRVGWLVSFWIVCGTCDLANAASDTALVLQGLTLEQAIGRLQQQGLPVVYSTDLVKPWMQVAANPARAEPAVQLDEILAPFGLRARRHSSGAYIVTRWRAVTVNSTGASRAESANAATAGRAALEEIEVVARPYQLTRELDAGAVTMLGTEIEKIPQFGGDALRAISLGAIRWFAAAQSLSPQRLSERVQRN